MKDFVSASDFFKTISSNDRVYLLIRHGERRHITPQDSNAGALVGLTDKGKAQAYSLGKLFPVEGEAVYFSSPVGRCIETAELIGKGRESVGGPSLKSVEVLDSLGDFFVKDRDQYLAVLNEKFYPSICAWIGGASHPAYCDLHDRSEDMRRLMLEKGTARFNIFASHDAWIIPCLAHFCNMEFTPSCWMNFLTGVAFVASPRGDLKAVPVTGLESGFLKF